MTNLSDWAIHGISPFGRNDKCFLCHIEGGRYHMSNSGDWAICGISPPFSRRNDKYFLCHIEGAAAADSTEISHGLFG